MQGEDYSNEIIRTQHLRIPAILSLGGRYYFSLGCFGTLPGNESTGIVIRPYIGMGGGVALGGKMKTETSVLTTDQNITQEQQLLSSMTFKPGGVVYGEAGITFHIIPQLSVFLETNLIAVSLMNSTEKISSCIVNGKDVTNDLTVAQREKEFVKNVAHSDYHDPDKPTVELAERYPCSGISIKGGISWNFGKAERPLPELNQGSPGVKDLQPINPPGIKPEPKPAIKGSGVTKEKVKAATLLEICKNCPPIDLTILSNNDEDNFSDTHISELKTGPWGKALLDSISFKQKEILCERCDGSGYSCCCRLSELTVAIYFHLYLNTAAIEKGVWLNTNTRSGQYMHTLKGGEFKENQKDAGDWKRVDKRSVIVHERQHFSDFKEAISKVIREQLRNFPVIQYPCSTVSSEDCRKKINLQLNNLFERLGKSVRKEVNKIAAHENENYTKGELELKARTVQAAELNSR